MLNNNQGRWISIHQQALLLTTTFYYATISATPLQADTFHSFYTPVIANAPTNTNEEARAYTPPITSNAIAQLTPLLQRPDIIELITYHLTAWRLKEINNHVIIEGNLPANSLDPLIIILLVVITLQQMNKRLFRERHQDEATHEMR